MKIPKYVIPAVVVGVVAVLGFRGEAIAADEQPAISQERLDSLTAALDNQETRMAAVAELIAMADRWLYLPYRRVAESATDCPEQDRSDRLRREAVRVLDRCLDMDTVGKALSHPSQEVQWWALTYLPVAPDVPEKWSPLFPKLEKLAVEGDANIRSMAVEKLRGNPASKGFLARRVEEETSPEVLMHLMVRYGAGRAGYERQFCARVLRLLSHEDERVRRDAMRFIAFNKNLAEMWRFAFGNDVFDRLIELTQARSAAERSSAVGALLGIRNLDAARRCEALLRLAKDESENVRRQVPAGLADDLDRPEVRKTLDSLLNDPIPIVRYFTIMTLGPEKHLGELRELAKGSDTQCREWAAAQIKKIEEAKGAVDKR